MITLNVNGVSREIDADPDMPLLWALRDLLGMVQVIMVEDQVYVNDQRLRLDDRVEAGDNFAALWLRHEVGGLNLHATLTMEQWRRIVVDAMADAPPAHPRAALQALLQKFDASVAATEMTAVEFTFAGNEGVVSLLADSLPAAATARMPAFPPATIALVRAVEAPPPPQLLFVATTFTPEVCRIIVA